MIRPIHIWAMRDALRSPFESLLTAAALFLTILIVGTSLLVPQAISLTVRNILKAAPSIIVRRINAVGWQPIPIDSAVAAAAGVIGVTGAKARIWGVATGPNGPLTLVGVRHEDLASLPGVEIEQKPLSGQAIIGPGIRVEAADGRLGITGSVEKRLDIIGRLPRDLSIVAHDLVLLSMEDAGQLLGIPEGYASDLAVDVFHADEEAAILPDLSGAFPWPVRLITRTESLGMYATGYTLNSAIALMAAIPAVLTICLLVAVNVRRSGHRKKEMAIFKSVGWTTGDIVRLHFFRAAFIGFPAAAFGMAAAFLLVFGPANRWIGTVFLGWHTPPPLLNLNPEGAVIVLLEIAACVLIPFVGSALSPALAGASHDVQELLQGVEG